MSPCCYLAFPSQLWSWEWPTKKGMSHIRRGPRKTPKNLDAVWVHSPCIRGAVDDNVVQSGEKSTVVKLKQHGEFKVNTRRVQGEPKANPRQTRGEFKANTRCFKAEHRTNPRRTRGRHKLAWSWLGVALESTWESTWVSLKSAWSCLAVVWTKFKNSNLKNSDRWSRMRAVWLFFPQLCRSLGRFVYVWQGYKDG